jgi:molybdopterin-guanine dinucleotide biosynthesis protein A
MEGQAKALQPLAGEPLLRRVIDRVRPQVDCVLLSVESEPSGFEDFGLEQVVDPQPGSCGPLGGLLAGMRRLESGGPWTWLLLVPCDAPFLPTDLAVKLQERARAVQAPGAVISWRNHVQPTFSIWHRQLLDELETAVSRERMAGFRQFLDARPLPALEWPESGAGSTARPFFNINDRQALEEASRIIEQGTGE